MQIFAGCAILGSMQVAENVASPFALGVTKKEAEAQGLAQFYAIPRWSEGFENLRTFCEICFRLGSLCWPALLLGPRTAKPVLICAHIFVGNCWLLESTGAVSPNGGWHVFHAERAGGLAGESQPQVRSLA